MLAHLFAVAVSSAAPPTVDVAGGVGVFAPINRPWAVNPGIDGQVDVSGFVPGATWLAASGGAQLGVLLPTCDSCRAQPKWGVGVGPGVVTEHVDVGLFARVVGVGPFVQVEPALQVGGRFGVPGLPVLVRPYVALEGVQGVDLQVGVRVGGRVAGPPAVAAPPEPGDGPSCPEATTAVVDEAPFADADGDGIEDSIDTKPGEPSDAFFDQERLVTGRIVDRGGHVVTVAPSTGDNLRIRVGTEGGDRPAVVEVLGIELELAPGTELDCKFG